MVDNIAGLLGRQVQAAVRNRGDDRLLLRGGGQGRNSPALLQLRQRDR